MSPRTVADGFIAVGIGLAFTVLPVAILFGVIIAGTCRTETLEKFSNISGFNFEARIEAAKTLELSAIQLRLPSRPTGAPNGCAKRWP